MGALAAFAQVAATLAAAGPGMPCRPQPPLSAYEQQIRDAQAARATFGLRSDRAWVLRVWRSPRSREDDVLSGPASPFELRYFERRDRVEDAAGRAESSMLEHLPEAFGGVSIEDDNRRGAYLLVYVTADPGVHAERLRRRFPVPDGVRFRRVRFTEDELEDVQATLEQSDLGALRAEGIDVRGYGASLSRNAVVVDVITRRDDAQAVLQARFGPAVEVDVIARTASRLVCARADGFRPSPSGRTLRLRWTTNSVYRLERVVVRETARSVRIGIVERAPNGFVTLVATTQDRLVRLARPLGGRRVIDLTTGRPLRRLRPGPLR